MKIQRFSSLLLTRFPREFSKISGIIKVSKTGRKRSADSSKGLNSVRLKDMINDLKKNDKTLQATVDAANKREEVLTQEQDNLKERIGFATKASFQFLPTKFIPCTSRIK